MVIRGRDDCRNSPGWEGVKGVPGRTNKLCHILVPRGNEVWQAGRVSCGTRMG